MKQYIQLFKDLVYARKNQGRNQHVNEVELFRCLIDTLGEFPNIATTETHGPIAQVRVPIPYPFIGNQCEIGDFITIWFNTQKKVRISIVQAKRKRDLFNSLHFPICKLKGSSRQHYLMVDLPPIFPSSGYLWFERLLDFHKYINPEFSLYQYGIFYETSLGWELLSISPHRMDRKPFLTENYSLEFSVNSLKQTTTYIGDRFNYDYLSFSCNLRRYFIELLNGKVGMPITIDENPWLLKILQSNLKGTTSPVAINFFNTFMPNNSNSFQNNSEIQESNIPIILIDGSE